MSSSSVQFRSLDTVVTAYVNRNCPSWAVWQGRQFMFKYEGTTVKDGEEQLNTLLEMLHESSNAIYTLKVYEGNNKINEKTPCDGSFNFRLNEPEQMITNSQYSRLNSLSEMQSKVAALEKIIKEKEDEEDEEDSSAIGQIQEVLTNPFVIQLAQSLFGIKLPGAEQSQQQQRAISGVPDTNQVNKAYQAVEKLKGFDSKIGDHLEKLAIMAETKPQNLNFLLDTLDQL